MAAGATYTPIATTTLGSAQSSVTFSSISGSYTDLVLVASAIAESLKVQFNSDTGNNYSRTYLTGDGSSATSGRASNAANFFMTSGTGSSPAASLLHIMNYSNTTTYKTALGRGNDTSSVTVANVNLWRSTSAITSITLTANTGNISSGATFTLYGIVAA